MIKSFGSPKSKYVKTLSFSLGHETKRLKCWKLSKPGTLNIVAYAQKSEGKKQVLLCNYNYFGAQNSASYSLVGRSGPQLAATCLVFHDALYLAFPAFLFSGCLKRLQQDFILATFLCHMNETIVEVKVCESIYSYCVKLNIYRKLSRKMKDRNMD